MEKAKKLSFEGFADAVTEKLLNVYISVKYFFHSRKADRKKKALIRKINKLVVAAEDAYPQKAIDAIDEEIRNLEHDISEDGTYDIDDLKLDEPFSEEKAFKGEDTADKELKPLSTDGLPIVLVEKENMSRLEQREFKHKHLTQNVYEYITFPVEVKNIAENCRIPFEHKATECELIFKKDTIIISDSEIASNIIIKRPDIYYRSKSESERFPCECLCVVDDKTFELFKAFEDIEEKIMKINTFSRLSKPQRDFIFSMASRAIQPDDDENSPDKAFTPIRDLDSLEMMYEVCKYTYKPSVRARIDSLRTQLQHSHGSDRIDIINQLAFAIGIDTEAREHPVRTYEECMAIMDKHIYGMTELKENVVEFIIAMQQSGASYFVLLLVGPPGVGKTCFCDAIAECLELPTVHIDCSGVDNITMSGLIKSYSGAKAGKFMDGIFEKGRTDVLVRLDEVDKMARGKDGDPYGSLIKPLGPQRTYFDEYVADDTDVSATKFVATANDISAIPGYILSRFENCIFYIDPYTAEEKLEIAQNHIIPKKLAEFKLTATDCAFDKSALKLIINEYCSDEGVRELEGNITMLLRKVITGWTRELIQKPFTVDSEYVKTHLKKRVNCAPRKTIGFAG